MFMLPSSVIDYQLQGGIIGYRYNSWEGNGRLWGTCGLPSI